MNCIHRNECQNEHEHTVRSQNDFWWLGLSAGFILGMFATLAIVLINAR